jgi:hypothetical protein
VTPSLLLRLVAERVRARQVGLLTAEPLSSASEPLTGPCLDAIVALSRALGADGDRAAVDAWRGAPEQTADNLALALEFAALLWDEEQA